MGLTLQKTNMAPEQFIPTLRENPAKSFQLLVGPTFVKSHDQLKGAFREEGKSLRCAKNLGWKTIVSFPKGLMVGSNC